jgi:hypothetical protein
MRTGPQESQNNNQSAEPAKESSPQFSCQDSLFNLGRSITNHALTVKAFMTQARNRLLQVDESDDSIDQALEELFETAFRQDISITLAFRGIFFHQEWSKIHPPAARGLVHLDPDFAVDFIKYIVDSGSSSSAEALKRVQALEHFTPLEQRIFVQNLVNNPEGASLKAGAVTSLLYTYMGGRGVISLLEQTLKEKIHDQNSYTDPRSLQFAFELLHTMYSMGTPAEQQKPDLLVAAYRASSIDQHNLRFKCLASLAAISWGNCISHLHDLAEDRRLEPIKRDEAIAFFAHLPERGGMNTQEIAVRCFQELQPYLEHGDLKLIASAAKALINLPEERDSAVNLLALQIQQGKDVLESAVVLEALFTECLPDCRHGSGNSEPLKQLLSKVTIDPNLLQEALFLTTSSLEADSAGNTEEDPDKGLKALINGLSFNTLLSWLTGNQSLRENAGEVLRLLYRRAPEWTRDALTELAYQDQKILTPLAEITGLGPEMLH